MCVCNIYTYCVCVRVFVQNLLIYLYSTSRIAVFQINENTAYLNNSMPPGQVNWVHICWFQYC